MNVTSKSDANLISVSLTRPDNTDAYNASDVIGTNPATNIIFNNVLDGYGSEFIIFGVRLRIDVASIPSGMTGFRLHLYNAAPTAIADNAAYNLPSGDRAKYLGYVTISTPIDLGATIWAQDDGVNFTSKLAAGSNTLYGIIETIGAFTPSALSVKTISLIMAGV
jgi:hypothetical protein